MGLIFFREVLRRKLISLQIDPWKVLTRPVCSSSTRGIMAAFSSEVKHSLKASVYTFNMQHINAEMQDNNRMLLMQLPSSVFACY